MRFPPRTSPLVAAALALALPSALPAQTSSADFGGEIFWAHTTSLPGSPGLGGIAMTMSAGGVGVRGSAAFNRQYDEFAAVTTPWTADVDLFVTSRALGQVIGIAMGSFMPVGFVGVGQQGVRAFDGSTPTVSTFSYGAGASVPLFSGLRLQAEFRQRRALGDMAEYGTGIGTGREIRVGLTFGGGSRSAGSGRSSGGTTRRGGVVLAGSTRDAPVASARARRVVATGDEYLGVRYVYGGEDPETGLDCSAFTQLVFRRNGVTLPRTSRQQVAMGRGVPMDLGVMRAGDLLFFAGDGNRIDHVAIYAGNSRILHATSSGGAVRYDDLGSDRGAWFVNHLVAVRRVLDEDGASLVRSLRAAQLLAPVLDRGDLAPRPR